MKRRGEKLHLNSKRKNRFIIITTLIFLIILAIPTFFWMKNTNKIMAERRKSMMSPVIMIPGSSATTNRFNELVTLLNKDTHRNHSLLKIEVQTDGSLKYSGKIDRNDNEPFIVVGFENNHDGYSNIKKQTGWFDIAFNALTEQYKFNNFKAFGHSNGGLIWTYWLEHYYDQYRDEISIKKLMTLGTPYNFDETNSKNRTLMLNEFIKNRKEIPSSLIVYSIYGGESYDSDGLVPESSAEAGKYIFQNQVKHYTAMTVTGADAQHSSLPQNKEVVQVIEQYLLNTQKERENQQPANNIKRFELNSKKKKK